VTVVVDPFFENCTLIVTALGHVSVPLVTSEYANANVIDESLVTLCAEGALFAAAAGNCTGLWSEVVELKTAPDWSWSVSSG
jgi:hypothetical protein